jgi:tyrosyl-tRNA synthetase
MQPAEALAYLSDPAVHIVSLEELKRKLEEERPLRVKLGIDPTSADIHLGHSLALRALRRFQDLGHQAILIIGDFTGMIGDPSGRSATRRSLSRDEIMRNAQTYREQAFKILDPAKTEIRFNGEWFKNMNFEDIIQLTSQVTLQQMLQRDDFKKRIRDDQPIHAHEILYPIMQGWDSVKIDADVEMGGTDQLFNILVGRDLLKAKGKPEQVVFLLPLLVGLDGVRKMSKSYGNQVGVADPPREQFAKLMSISDDTMKAYYSLLFQEGLPPLHPMDAKKKLAFRIVEQFHGGDAALQSQDAWIARVSEKRLSDADLPIVVPGNHDLASIVVSTYANAFALTKSRGDVRRLIEQGSVQLDGEKLRDPKAVLQLRSGQVLRLDKTRAVRIA